MRMKMLDARRDNPEGGSRRKAVTPNTYVCPTDKRRDSLRWAVREQLAVVD